LLTVLPRTFDVLCVLAQRAGQTVQKAELMELVWPGIFVEESNLAHHVSQLRRLLGDNAKQPQFIATVPTQGYRFVEEVRPVVDESTPVPVPLGPIRPPRAVLARQPVLAGLLLVAVLVTALAVWRPGTGASLGSSPNAGASVAYERGRFLLAQNTPDSTQRAVAALEEAVRLAPRFAPAYAELASAHVSLFLARRLSRAQARDRAQSAAAAALALDDSLSAAHAAQGAVFLQLLEDPGRAQAALRRAIALDPMNAAARDLLARALRHDGRYEESIAEARRALDLAPTSVRAHMNLVQSILFSQRQLEQGLDVCRRALELDPRSGPVLDQAADLAERAGRTDEAVAFRARAERAWGHPGLAALLEQKHAAEGYSAAMAAYFESKLAALDAADPVTGFDRGRLLLRLGRLDEAFAAFDAAAGAGFSVGVYALGNHPAYSAIKADPRFEQLAARARGRSGTQPEPITAPSGSSSSR
jgi:DNA-binding winged helix-turn-helix (wHTH) protein/tetratricopeptide (TPR) repeat protein